MYLGKYILNSINLFYIFNNWKGFVLILFFPALIMGQFRGPSSSEVSDAKSYATLVYLGTSTDPSYPLSSIKVNDIITLGVKVSTTDASVINGAHIDISWNKKALELQGSTIYETGTSAERIEPNKKFNVNSNYDYYDLNAQWSYGSWSASNSDWESRHLILYGSNLNLQNKDYYVRLNFKIIDPGAGHNFADNVYIPNGRVTSQANDPAAGNFYSPNYAFPNFALSLDLSPKVTLTDTDTDNIINPQLSPSDSVTITAEFDRAMTATPTISITGIVTNVIMTPVSGTNSYTYAWDTSSGTLSDGTYSATVSGSDLAGNAYSGTDSITFTLDATAPTVTLTDTDSDNLVTTSEVVTITAGFSEAMTATPTISITGIVTNVIMTPVSGTNSYTYAWDTSSGTLSDGTYSATVSGSDLAGNAYSGTDSITFTLDATAPTVTLTDTDSDNLVTTSEVVTITAGFSEAMTATPTISITGIVTNVIMTPVSGTNSYTYAWDTSSGTLSDGTYSATVSGSDLAGNAYSGTDSITFTLDATAPTVTITSSDSDNTVKSADSNITVTATFNESMASAPTITIGSAVDNVVLTATSSTTWTYNWDISSIAEGSYTVTVTGTDLAGNTYTGTDSITLIVDNTAPTATLSDNDADNLLSLSSSVTITAVFNESMSATPTVLISGTSVSGVMTQISGTNSYTFNWDLSGSSLNDGTYTATVSGTDLAGNAYSGTDSITFTLDATAPTIQSIYSSTNASYNQGDTVTLYLVADEALTVDTSSGTPTISFDSSGTASYTTGSGTSSLTFTYIVDTGENSSDLNATAVSLNSATIKDNVGNNLDLTLTASGTAGALNANNDIIIDTTSPTLVITPPAGLRVTNSSVVTVTLTYNEPVTGLTTNVASYGAGTTGVSSLKLISFTSSTTAVVEIYPSAEGTVKLVHSSGAPNVTDLAGNTIASTVSCSFTYDITPPSAPVSPTLSIASDSGPRDYVTGVVTPTFEGTAEANSTIYLYNSNDLNTAIGTALAAGNGSYSVTVSDTATLSEATYNFVVVAVDQAGNISSASSPTQVQVLTSAPPTPTVAPDLSASSDKGPSNTDNLTNVTTPTFSGTVTPTGLTVWLYQGSTQVASVTAAGDGSYTISPTSALTSGDYVFTIKTENAIGNFSGNSPPVNVTIQTTPQSPTVPTLATSSDLGVSTSDNITSDNTPTLTGTASPNTVINIYDNTNTFVVSSTSDSSGNYSITFPDSESLSDSDNNDFYIELVDTFGNTASSTLLDLTIDTTAPTADPVATDKKIAASSTTTYTTTGIANTDQVWLVPSTISTDDLKAYLADPSSVSSLTLNTNITKQTTGNNGTITTPSAGGIYKIVVVDPAGNFSSLSTGKLDIDLTGPKVTSITTSTANGVYTDDDANPSNSDTVTFTVNFDERLP
jgi:hypothetical protein